MIDGGHRKALPQEAAALPDPVRRGAFNAARAAIREYLAAAGYRVDDIGELELLDAELRAVVEAWDHRAAMVH
jgi:hypothetical protein